MVNYFEGATGNYKEHENKIVGYIEPIVSIYELVIISVTNTENKF